MSGSNPWEAFFDAHAAVYDENEFTHNTVREVDFLLEALELQPGATVLDVGCGTGRHAIELSARGYVLTGLDLSAGMLARARAKAREAGVQVEWIQGDAAQFSLPAPVEAVICLCEGACGLLGAEEDAVEQPLAILRNVNRALHPGGKCVFTVLNGYRMIRAQSAAAGEARLEPLTLSEISTGPPYEGGPLMTVRERGFVPTELVLLFRLGGMEVLHLWGGTAGSWDRHDLDLDEYEIMVVARKAGECPTLG